MTNTGATIIIIARAQYNVNKKNYNNIAFVAARARLRADSDNYRRVKLQYASEYRVPVHGRGEKKILNPFFLSSSDVVVRTYMCYIVYYKQVINARARTE